MRIKNKTARFEIEAILIFRKIRGISKKFENIIFTQSWLPSGKATEHGKKPTFWSTLTSCNIHDAGVTARPYVSVWFDFSHKEQSKYLFSDFS